MAVALGLRCTFTIMDLVLLGRFMSRFLNSSGTILYCIFSRHFQGHHYLHLIWGCRLMHKSFLSCLDWRQKHTKLYWKSKYMLQLLHNILDTSWFLFLKSENVMIWETINTKKVRFFRKYWNTFRNEIRFCFLKSADYRFTIRYIYIVNEM